jgi:ppGpp synthetase/RelA/SpoT-type nucleotidyltranferase
MASGHEGAIPETPAPQEARFDFLGWGRKAGVEYLPVRGLCEEFADALRAILRVALREEQISVQTIDARGKSVESLEAKAEKPHENDANRPKYANPLADITDLAGVRVIVFLENDVAEVRELVRRVFEVREELEVDALSGYRGLHLIVALRDNRSELLEYKRFSGRLAEIQVRTVLQHAWAEIEHGIGYKPRMPIPEAIRRQLRDLSGTLGTADHGLQEVASRVVREQIAGELPTASSEGTATASPAPSVGGGEGGVGEPASGDPAESSGEAPEVT